MGKKKFKENAIEIKNLSKVFTKKYKTKGLKGFFRPDKKEFQAVNNINLEVKKGERGIIHISSAASADRYLDNEEATNAYYYYEDGVKWANLGDIAVQNQDGSYSMLGRSTDSYVDEFGERHYLFDIEYSLDIEDPVIEWEISAFKNGTKHDIVAQIIMKPEYI